ncbi:unnamed protein product [Cutaneotrichosporon oleaginosum]
MNTSYTSMALVTPSIASTASYEDGTESPASSLVAAPPPPSGASRASVATDDIIAEPNDELDYTFILRNLHSELLSHPSTSQLAAEVSELDLLIPPPLPRYAVRPHITISDDDDDDADDSDNDNIWLSRESQPTPPTRTVDIPPCTAPSLDALCTIFSPIALAQGFWLVRGNRLKLAPPHDDVAGAQGAIVEKRYLDCGMARRRPKVQEPFRKRRYASRKTNCKFKMMIAILRNGIAVWPGWTLDQRAAGWHQHNHGLLEASEMVQARRYDAEQVAAAESMLQAGLPARRIVPRLNRDFPNTVRLSRKDIYNAAYRLHTRARLGGTETEALLRNLDATGELYRGTRDPDTSVLTSIVYTTRRARALLLRWPTVLLVDCTNGTNKYDMPLLHIVGVTACNNTFTAGIALLKGERYAHLRRALQDFVELVQAPQPAVFLTDRDSRLRRACKTVWPSAKNVLCLWHIEQNIKVAAAPPLRRIFGSHKLNDTSSVFHTRPEWEEHLDSVLQGWRMIVRSRSEEELAEQRAIWVETFSQGRYADEDGATLLGDALRIGEAALDADAEEFVHFHVDGHRHLGQRNNSRLEGMHGVLKKHLGDSPWRRDLLATMDRIRDFFTSQWASVTHTMQAEMRTHVQDGRSLFSNVRNVVSRRAMELVFPQLAIAFKRSLWAAGQRVDRNGELLEEPRACTGTFRKAYDLPCAHEIEKRLSGLDARLRKADFGRMWRLVSLDSLNTLVRDVEGKYFAHTPTGIVNYVVDVLSSDEEALSDEEASSAVIRTEIIDTTLPEDEETQRTLNLLGEAVAALPRMPASMGPERRADEA